MKISSSRENPIDILNIRLADFLCPLFKKINLTANNITFLSMIFGLISIFYLYKHNWKMFAIMYYISYFFDCMDGHYARKYKMVSKFGDYFDHIKDVLVFLGIFIVLVRKYIVSLKIWIIFVIVLFIFTILMMCHIGCQEKIYHEDDDISTKTETKTKTETETDEEKKNKDNHLKNEESPSLTKLKNICFGKAKNTIQFTKWFGCGTWVLILLVCIYYLHKYSEKPGINSDKAYKPT
jgi:phosphatidylglycerophosphate synthase